MNIASFEKVLKNIIPGIIDISSVPGGDINRTYYIKTKNDELFVKMHAACPDDFFEKEKQGLLFLKKNSSFRIPEIISSGNIESIHFLIMEYIQKGHRNDAYYRMLGKKLAEMHRTIGSHFGLDNSNYIGTLIQENNPCDTWSEFYIRYRVSPYLKDIFPKKEEQDLILKDLHAIMQRHDAEIHPSPLHGDLWSGNHFADEKGEPVLIDPAVYFGDRCIDIAMLELFGSLPDSFYEEYFSIFPKEKNWSLRMEICTLYPLLVHTRLFGGHYKASARNLMEKILKNK